MAGAIANTGADAGGIPPFFSISELAERWRCSRGTVYNVLRGRDVVDFAKPGARGHKLIPARTVTAIESGHTRRFR